MKIPEYFISCDWGTSNFRLRLIKSDSLAIIDEIVTNKGIKVLYNDFLKQEIVSQKDFFANYLLSQVHLLPKNHQNHIIVASGMVTANIGLHELAYAKMPFDGSGKSIISKRMQLSNQLEIVLISGVKNDFGMMRGEETQAIGLLDYIDTKNESVLILPGTHSKHLTYINGEFTELKSFMTGEVFELLATKSILAASIDKPSSNIIEEWFFKGVSLAINGELTANLFSIRANYLSNKATNEENYYFLSGLLIGDELKYLKDKNINIYLSATESLARLYKLALDFISKENNNTVFTNKITKEAILVGQKKILTQI